MHGAGTTQTLQCHGWRGSLQLAKSLPSALPQAAFANWCKRVLQTELLISPQKSTLTASGGVHLAAACWCFCDENVRGQQTVAVAGVGLGNGQRSRQGIRVTSFAAAIGRPWQRVPSNVPAIPDPSARSPQAGIPRQQHSAGSSGWRGCAEGRQQPAAVSGQRQRRSGGRGSGRAGRSLAAAAAERRRGAAAGQQRWRRRQWRCCRRGPSCSQEAPGICRWWARNGGGVMGGHYCMLSRWLPG